jgi:hypothetical protein
MAYYPEGSLNQVSPDLEAIATTIKSTAAAHKGDSRQLLALLRLLEALHREIRDGLFQESLPDNRQALYALLRDIEADGGWPYIYRMRLQSLLSSLAEEELNPESDDPSES